MSSADVDKTAEIIDNFVDTADLDLTETTLKNLAETVDNINTETERRELQRKKETSDVLRESAVKVVGKIAEGAEDDIDTFIPLETVGELVAT